MRAWLLTVGEPLPSDPSAERLWRTGLLARALAARGHEVVWWSSAFDHFARRSRTPQDVPIRIDGRVTLWQLSGAEYRRNVSLARLRNHRQVARRFRELSPSQPRPDVILSSLPTLELCDAAVAFGAVSRVPVALDVRDLWPDVLWDVVPRPLRPLARMATRPMTTELRRASAGAAAILGVTDEFVDWAIAAAGRPRRDRDRAFPMAYSATAPDAAAQARAVEFWRAHGIDQATRQPLVCFFGTLGWMFDFETVLAAAEALRGAAPEVRLVICGSGSAEEPLRRRAAALPNVVLPGRVGAAEIHELMRRSIAGLAPYRPYRNFDDNVANKPIEYLSAGLPIVASETRALRRLIDEDGCGLTYAHGDARALAAAVVRLVRDPDERARMSARAAALFERRFVAERVYGEMAAHLETIAASA